MTLHETYTTLLQRGMKPVENLSFVQDYHGSPQWFYGQEYDPSCCMTELDATRLIAMSAVDWLMEDSWNYTPGECSRLSFSEVAPVDLEETNRDGVSNTPSTVRDIMQGPKWHVWQWYKPHKRRIHRYGSGATLLDAIIIWSEHLETEK